MDKGIYVMTLLIPLLMLATGLVFSRWTPKSINYLIGYRTRRSMINQETWNFANRTMGRIWITWSLLLLIPSGLVLFFLKTRVEQNLETWIVVLTLVQLAVLILSIIPVERALKAKFDDKGRPRKPD